jgi:hypothetical protein
LEIDLIHTENSKPILFDDDDGSNLICAFDNVIENEVQKIRAIEILIQIHKFSKELGDQNLIWTNTTQDFCDKSITLSPNVPFNLMSTCSGNKSPVLALKT